MDKIKIPSLDTAITVLCDMTREQVLTPALVEEHIKGRKSAGRVRVMRPNCGAPYTQEEIYRLLAECQLMVAAGEKIILILTNNLQVTSLAAILMNSKAEKHLAGMPIVDPSNVMGWEVWDDANVRISEKDGMITSTSFDEAFRPIVSDIMRLQKLNAPAPESGADSDEPEEYTIPSPRVLEKAVVDEGVVVNSPKDIIRKRIDAAARRANEELGEHAPEN